MKKIESLSNQEIKETAKLAQKKFRNAQGLFLLEGYKPVFEAFREGVEIKTLYTTGQNLEKFSFLKDKITIVTEPVLEKNLNNRKHARSSGRRCAKKAQYQRFTRKKTPRAD